MPEFFYDPAELAAVEPNFNTVPCTLKITDEFMGGGFVPGLLNIVFGPPHGGKTAFVMTMVSDIAHSSKRIAMVGLDEPAWFTQAKLLAYKDGCAMLEAARIPERKRLEKMERLYPDVRVVKKDMIRTVGDVTEAVESISIGAWGMKDPEIVVLDYLGILEPELLTDNGFGMFGEVMKSLKPLTHAYPNTVFLILHQTNKGGLNVRELTLGNMEYGGEKEVDGHAIAVKKYKPETKDDEDDSETPNAPGIHVSVLKNKLTGQTQSGSGTLYWLAQSGKILNGSRPPSWQHQNSPTSSAT